eukprot:13074896-Heterocapsa_arctica.AAC.1
MVFTLEMEWDASYIYSLRRVMPQHNTMYKHQATRMLSRAIVDSRKCVVRKPLRVRLHVCWFNQQALWERSA